MTVPIPRPEYPRPQFVRDSWLNLNGEWTCEFDPGKSGFERGLPDSSGFTQKILVPFCPESKLSGLAHTDFIEQMFYHKKLDIPAVWTGKRILLHFGGVDYRAEGFVNGKSVGVHFGGMSSFEFDLTEHVTPGKSADFVLAVTDEGRRGVQAGGKQSVRWHSEGCFYTRTTGIWQTVWLEAVNPVALKRVAVTPEWDGGAFAFRPEYYGDESGLTLKITVSAAGKVCAEGSFAAQNGAAHTLTLDTVRAWSLEDPFLYDLRYELCAADGTVLDRADSYAGLRKVHCADGKVYLNNRPVFLRFVLDQGFYPDGVWTAPADADLKRDIELAMAAGFNGARLHQKVFEERFHYWADKLGYLTWGESASWGVGAVTFASSDKPSPEFWEGAYAFQQEWRDVVERDYNHPSIIAWTPFNETGPGSALDSYRRLMCDIYDLTKRLDPTRPCNETSGYTHMKTDLWTVHLYRKNADELKQALFPDDFPVARHSERSEGYAGQPYINDEFGGFLFIPPERLKFAANTWGYYGMDLKTGDELVAKIAEQAEYMRNCGKLAGFCYTQLTDVEQEQNGVYNYDRTAKVDPVKLRKAFAGE